MSRHSDKVTAWISGMIQSLLSRPEMWGSVHAVEMQFLLLLDVRAALNGNTWETERRLFGPAKQYRDFLSTKGINPNTIRGPAGFPQSAETHDQLVQLCREFLEQG